MKVFVDTSAFYAVLDASDRDHSRAARLWTRIHENRDHCITSNYVIVETTALLQNRLGMKAVRGFHDDVLPAVETVFVDRNMHRLAAAAHLASNRRGLSLVDCVSFEVMRSLFIRTAFALDKHFAQNGFALLR